MTKKEHLLAAFRNAIIDIMYYDRKDCDDLSCDDVTQLMESGDCTIDEIITAFSQELRTEVPKQFDLPATSTKPQPGSSPPV